MKRKVVVKPLKKRMLHVTWRDSCSLGGRVWQRGKEAEDMKPSVVQSVGFLVAETPISLTLAPHVTDDGDVAGDMCIPKGCIIKRRRLA